MTATPAGPAPGAASEPAPRSGVPVLRQVVLDTTDAPALAEFYRRLLDLKYQALEYEALEYEGDEPGETDRQGAQWLVLREPSGRRVLAVQQVPDLPEPTWPQGPRPQMLHLDLAVHSIEELRAAQQRALGLGARLLQDRSDDPDEPLFVDADLAGHPFCLFVARTD